MKKRNAQEQKLADDARSLRTWREWHREQLEEALAGVRRDVLERLMEQLKDLRSACALVDFIAAQDWESVDADTRAIALFAINRAITALRERQKLPAINDALPGEPPSAFRMIREIITKVSPPSREKANPKGVSG